MIEERETTTVYTVMWISQQKCSNVKLMSWLWDAIHRFRMNRDVASIVRDKLEPFQQKTHLPSSPAIWLLCTTKIAKCFCCG